MNRLFSFLSLPAFIIMSGLIVSCAYPDETDDTDPVETGTIHLEFDNVVGNQDLKLDTVRYQNSLGEDFTVDRLNYFISNIKLNKIDGTSFIVPQDSSYFLIRETNAASQKIVLNNVLTGEYSGVEFTIGVDSLRSVSDISKRKGILDKDMGPTNEEAMYWDWNPGYIFLKLEGSSDSATTANGKYEYHIGGFGGLTDKTLNNIKTVKLSFAGQKAIVTTSIVSNVRLKADVLKIFNGPTQVSIKNNPGVMYSPFSKNIADNYVHMFSLDKITIN